MKKTILFFALLTVSSNLLAESKFIDLAAHLLSGYEVGKTYVLSQEGVITQDGVEKCDYISSNESTVVEITATSVTMNFKSYENFPDCEVVESTDTFTGNVEEYAANLESMESDQLKLEWDNQEKKLTFKIADKSISYDLRDVKTSEQFEALSQLKGTRTSGCQEDSSSCIIAKYGQAKYSVK